MIDTANGRLTCRQIAVMLARELDPTGAHKLVEQLPKEIMEGQPDDYDYFKEVVHLEDLQTKAPVSMALALVGSAAKKAALAMTDLGTANMLMSAATDLAKCSLTFVHWQTESARVGFSKKDGKVISFYSRPSKAEEFMGPLQQELLQKLGAETLADIPKAFEKLKEILERED